MVKLYMLLLVGCSLYVYGADPDNSDNRKAMLEKWGGKQRNLSDLSDDVQGNQHIPNEPNAGQQEYVAQANQIYESFVKKPGGLPVIHTKGDQEEAVKTRDKLLKLALQNLQVCHKGAEEIMHLAQPLEVALRTYRKSDATEGPSPRTIHLWGEFREIDDRENYRNNIFFQLAKERLKENEDVQSRRAQLVGLAKDALNANYDEMSLMIMRVTVAFDRGLHDGQMSNEVIDTLFGKAAADELEIGNEFSPRTRGMFDEISLSKATRKESLEELL